MGESLAWLAAPSTGCIFFCTVELLAQMPRHPGIDVVEERLEWNGGEGFGLLNGRRELARKLCVERGVRRIRQLPETGQVTPKPVHGIFGGPRLLFPRSPITGRIVARRVRAHAIGDRLDECGTFARPRPLDRPAEDPVEREKIIAIHPHARQPVAARVEGATARRTSA